MITNDIKNTIGNLSSWRKSLTYNNKIDPEYYIDTYKINIENESEDKWPTSITTNDDYIAYTSALKKNNFIIYKDNKKSKFDKSNVNDIDIDNDTDSENEKVMDNLNDNNSDGSTENINQYKVVHKNSYNYPIYDVSWEKNFIALGSENGKVNLIKVSPDSLENSEGTIIPEEEFMCEMQSSNNKVMPSLPNQFIFSQRIHSVDLNPTPINENVLPTHFIATERNLIHMWNIERQFYINQEPTELDTIFNAKFCPHQSNSSLIAAAGSNGKLHIYDSTKFSKNSVIWKCSSSKKNIEITDIAWNPFVPYWIAVSRSDAVVNVWDLRYNKGHVGQINGHYHSIKSIAWSNTHSEILATGSLDRSFNTWNFKKGTYFTLENKKNINNLYEEYNYNVSTSENLLNLQEYKQLKMLNAKLITTYTENYGGIINVISSKSKPDVFYTLTNDGEIFSHTLKDNLFEKTINYKYDSLRSMERKVELNNYTRNIGKAYKNIISLSKLQKEENILADLIDICTPYPEIKAENWQFPPLQNSDDNMDNHCNQEYIKQFKEDLEKYSAKLPPGYASSDEKWLGGITDKLKDDLNIVKLRINTLSSIKSNKWEFILENEEKLLNIMEKDPLFMEVDEIKQMISCIITHNHLAALKIGLRINKIFDSQEDRNYSDLTAINHILLFPTVYDIDMNMITYIPELESTMSSNSVDTTTLFDPSIHIYSKNKLLDDFIKDENSINKIPAHAYHSLTGLLQDSNLIIPLLELEIKVDEIVYDKSLSKEEVDSRIIDVLSKEYIITEIPVNEDINNKTASRILTSAHQKCSISVITNRLYLDALLRNSKFEEYFYTSMDLFMQYFQLDFSRTITSTIDRVALVSVKKYIDQIYQKIASDITDIINDIQQIQSFDADSFNQLMEKLTSNILIVADLISLLNKIGVVCANGIEIIPLLDDKSGLFFNFTQKFLIELIEQLSSNLYSFIATFKIVSEKIKFDKSTDELKNQIIEKIVISDNEIRKKPLYDYFKIQAANKNDNIDENSNQEQEKFSLTIDTIDCIISDLNNFDNLDVDLNNL